MSTAPLLNRRFSMAIAAVASAALLLAGCTGSNSPDEPLSPSPTTTTSSSGDPDPAPAEETTTPEPPSSEVELPDDDPTSEVPFPADLQSDTGQASDGAALSPTGFRVGVHDNFDRVVVDFSGSGTPGWSAQYTDAPTAQGSGMAVDLLGSTAMLIKIDGVTIPTVEGAQPWGGPNNLMPASTGTITQVYRGPLFEGVQEVFLGLTGKEPFRVYSLQNPTRLVIDVYHPGLVDVGPALSEDDPEAAAPFPANRKADTRNSSNGARLSPLDMRFAVHDGFDRIVLDLVGPGEPGWHGEYVKNPMLAGSGAPVKVRGKSDLQVSVTGVVYPIEDGAVEYRGLQRVRPRDGGNVREVVYGSIFEGQLELYVGLKSKQPFRVFRLADPTRVVIDVQHP